MDDQNSLWNYSLFHNGFKLLKRMSKEKVQLLIKQIAINLVVSFYLYIKSKLKEAILLFSVLLIQGDSNRVANTAAETPQTS